VRVLRNRLRALIGRLGLRSVQPQDISHDSRGRVDNVDSLAAADFGDFDPGSGGEGGGIPPGYVKSYDEGRPRK
jgi:hypothetical protein